MTEEMQDALLRELVSRCIDIEQLAWFEHSLIDALLPVCATQAHRESVSETVRTQFDKAIQLLLIDFEQLRDAECPSCAATVVGVA